MDGTGVLLSSFIQASDGHFDVEIIAYPNDHAMTYEELSKYVIENLPKSGRFFLLGESFGGPLALIVAERAPAGLAGVILCASFARFPVASVRLLAPFARFTPMWHLSPVISWLLLGRWASPELMERLLAVLGGLRSEVLRARIAEALRVDVLSSVSNLAQPVLLLRATEDRIIPAAASAAIARVAQAAQLVDVQAPHFMLQSAPNVCVANIAGFIRGAAF
jgi:pimeloyl-ACP methyl ester carboxylesterase